VSEEELRALAISLPLLLATIGLAVSMLGILVTRLLKNFPPAQVLRFALILPPFLVIGVAAALFPRMHISLAALVPLTAGIIGGATASPCEDDLYQPLNSQLSSPLSPQLSPPPC